MKRLLSLILFAAAIMTVAAGPAWAWTTSGNHAWLMERASTILYYNGYTQAHDWMETNMTQIKKGSSDADGLYDSREHYCDENGNGLKKSALLLGSGNFKSLATLGSGNYTAAFSAGNIPYAFGAALHCIQDAACPAHTCIEHNPASNGHDDVLYPLSMGFETTVDQSFYRTETTTIGSSVSSISDQIKSVAVSGAYYRGAALTCACAGANGGGYGGEEDNYTLAAQEPLKLAQHWSAWMARRFFYVFNWDTNRNGVLDLAELKVRYDTNPRNGVFDKAEAITAVVDYFAETLSKEAALIVVVGYFEIKGSINGIDANFDDLLAKLGYTTGAKASLPSVTDLQPCAPNPTTGPTSIHYQLASPANVSLRIYNISGQLVKTLANESKPAGHHSVQWNGLDNTGKKAAAGIYLYRLDTGSNSAVKKLMVVR